MKIYISADIEGTTGITHWDETKKEKPDYQTFQEQMTNEVIAACEGALNAGATEILLKDAHATGRNILVSRLPEEVKIIRGWSGQPFSMVQELDNTFDAIIFTGYHSRAGANTNPLAHSLNSNAAYIKINATYASEFLLHAYFAAMMEVPVAFVSGDAGLCQDVKSLNQQIETVAVNQGIGESTISIHPNLAVRKIKEGVARALSGGHLLACKIPQPERFEVAIRYKDPSKAYRASYFPGVQQIDTHTIGFQTTRYSEVGRLLMFVL